MGSRHREQFNGFKWKIRASKGKKPLRLNVGILFITNSYAKIHLRGEEGGRKGRKNKVSHFNVSLHVNVRFIKLALQIKKFKKYHSIKVLLMEFIWEYMFSRQWNRWIFFDKNTHKHNSHTKTMIIKNYQRTNIHTKLKIWLSTGFWSE